MIRAAIAIAIIICINSNMCNAMALNCSFISISLEGLGATYTCNATVLFDHENPDVVTAVYGVHQAGRGHGDVVGLYIYNNNLELFPVEIESFFPNIRGLVFHSNSITHIHRRHIAPFPNLVHLNLGNNLITLLDSNLFLGFDSIRVISMASNNLNHVGHEFIVPSVAHVYFASNPCIDSTALTPYEVDALRSDLLRNCPPTIAQIEEILESRANLLTDVDIRVRSLSNDVAGLEQVNTDLERRVAFLEGLVEDLKTIVESR